MWTIGHPHDELEKIFWAFVDGDTIKQRIPIPGLTISVIISNSDAQTLRICEILKRFTEEGIDGIGDSVLDKGIITLELQSFSLYIS